MVSRVNEIYFIFSLDKIKKAASKLKNSVMPSRQLYGPDPGSRGVHHSMTTCHPGRDPGSPGMNDSIAILAQ